MTFRLRSILLPLAALPTFVGGAPLGFNQDIRPILSEKCIACHGPDEKKRESDLRLDTPEGAYAALKEGDGYAIVPGKPEDSAVIKRILSKDHDIVMPPPHFHKEVTEEELAILKQWIREGAEYEAHWSYTPLERPGVPKPERHADRVANPIDAFVLKKLEAAGIEPSPLATEEELSRRLHLDLIGLPPSPGNPIEPDQVIDACLSNPAYGERMAVPWLDVARFADTVGYHGDQNQRIFPYRDYVIRSFNSNKPFDEFVIEQLAGDLLPDATDEQHIASGFNRLNLVTREGGAQSKEYFKKYAADRVRAVGAAFLGQTTGCAECHDHKYDPISQKDFYSLAAFFDDVQQWGVYNGYVGGTKYNGNNDAYTPERIVRSESLLNQLSGLQTAAVEILAAHAVEDPDRDRKLSELRDFAARNPDGWQVLAPGDARTSGKTGAELIADDSTVRFIGPADPKERTEVDFPLGAGSIGSIRLEALPDPANGGAVGRDKGGHFTLKPQLQLIRPGEKPLDLKIRWAQADLDREHGFAGGLEHGDRNRNDLDPKAGWQSAPKPGYEGPDSLTQRTQTAVFCLDQPLAAESGATLRVILGSNTARLIRVSQSPVLDPSPGMDAFTAPFLHSLESDDQGSNAAYHLCFTPTTKLPTESQQLLDRIRDCRSGWTRTLVTVSIEKPEFPTRVLPRGDWQNDSGELVDPAVFSFLPSESVPTDRKLNRLDLARWVVADENPLTARHFVNRLWKQFFGRGLSNILDDLGGQGEPPSHPELLDWLAVEFRESGWDVQHIVRLIVGSNTYRQAAAQREDLAEVDPYNRLFAQQTGRRLDAEFIRDQALAAAGLLERDHIGGPSVRIYQPENYYSNLNFPVRNYTAHLDSRQHRRSVYAHWQRTFLLPTLANFDAPARDECAADRLQANIPQQALTLLNDPVYVEAARGLATRVLTELPAGGVDERIDRMFRLLLARSPDETEKERLTSFFETQLTQFKDGTDDGNLYLSIGITDAPAALDRDELAAWSQTARLLLNLHETITRY
ncbi:hypothetical protein HAHE_03540 [Haloferula helveola]|uniref:Planctomycete cytochrome C n=1 Tax=Haloferula helveola TaxID=490095 RepID=A0ABM7RAR4_9BACT|nr:hypothetical protein HAHE_03540 [Haloferula helveola]